MKETAFSLMAILLLIVPVEQLYADGRDGGHDRHRHGTYRIRSHNDDRHDAHARVVIRTRVVHHRDGDTRYVRYPSRVSQHRRNQYPVYVSEYSDHASRHRGSHHHHGHDDQVHNLLLGLAIATPLVLQANHRHHSRHGVYGRRYRH